MFAFFEAAFPAARALAHLRLAGRVAPPVARLATDLPAQL
jgi:hypothetical protein